MKTLTPQSSRTGFLYDHHASPYDVIDAANIQMSSLFNEGRLDECVHESYTEDVQLWTDEKKLVSGRLELLKYFEDEQPAGSIRDMRTEEVLRLNDKHFIEKAVGKFADDVYNYINLYRFEEDGKWRCQMELLYIQ
ncbi:unnamed protein product [Rotaria magnacalcarata]|uniref:Nuclear transport factor 2 family protein n=1 Tax=Rotaria magnacalcarata TaxID=392030 RepID=A0A816XXI1_9BILA|nr:unnamed protein product [Rotaria magnacalcarata]CAF1419845.1 unnamed protein product [Rotaria magnacalcarata]CAF2100740.1 unnamed protein product [Rotaria magnacalcarata]CAF2152305.1 unnamed protein product [Rotaria magnacalcarata]